MWPARPSKAQLSLLSTCTISISHTGLIFQSLLPETSFCLRPGLCPPALASFTSVSFSSYFPTLFYMCDYLFILKFYLFIVCLVRCVWSSLACGPSLVVTSRGYSPGFSPRWLPLLQSTGSRCASSSRCSAWAQLLLCAWDLPGPGIEPVFPEWAGRFLTLGSATLQPVESFQTLDWTHVPCIGRRIPINCTSREVHNYLLFTSSCSNLCSMRAGLSLHCSMLFPQRLVQTRLSFICWVNEC